MLKRIYTRVHALACVKARLLGLFTLRGLSVAVPANQQSRLRRTALGLSLCRKLRGLLNVLQYTSLRFLFSPRVSLKHLTRAMVTVLVLAIGVLNVVSLYKPPHAAAATSSYLNFQARLLTSTGTVVPDGNYHIEYKIYDTIGSGASAQGVCSLDSSTDDCLWIETRTTGNLVRVVNGYFSVNLGSVTAFGATIPWDRQLYLTMRIGGTSGSPSWDPEMLSSSNRMTLTGVPYAFRAGTLASFNGTQTGTLSFGAVTNSPVLTLPNETGTICSTGSVCSGYAAATGGSGYVQLQGSTPGSAQTGHFNITGTGIAGTLQAATVQSAAAAALTISAHATSTWSTDSGNLSLEATAAASTINLGANANNKTINIGAVGSTANTTTVHIADTSGNSTQAVSIGSNGNTSNTIDIDAGTGVSGIEIGNTTTAHGIQIGSNATGDNDIVLGGLNSGSTTLVQGGTGTGVSLQVASGGTIAIGSTTASTLNFGTGAFAHTIAIGTNASGDNDISEGSTNSGSTYLLEGGTAATAIQIGNGTTAHGIQIGSNATGDNDILIGGTNSGSTLTLEGGTAANSIAIGNGATAHSIAIGAGSGANNTIVAIGSGVTGGSNTSTVTIGSANAAASATSIQGGNGAGAISIQAATSGTISLGTTNNNVITIGGSGQTSQLTLGQGTGTNTISIGGAAGNGNTQTINIGNSATAGSTTNLVVGSTIAGTTTLQSAGGVVLTTLGSATSPVALCRNSSNIISSCGINTAGVTLQQAYDASTGGTTPEIKLDSTRGALDIQDANSTISGSLLTVRASNGGGLGTALFDVNSTGKTTLQNSTNSTTAFQIQNASSTTNGNLFLADTTNVNLIANPSAETNGTGWAINTGSGSAPASSATYQLYGNSSLAINTSATANAGAKFDSATLLSTTTQYSLSFWAKIGSGSFTVQAGRSDTDAFGGETTCSLSSTTVTTDWARYTCTFTTGTVTTGGYIFIRQSDSTSRTWYVDGVQLEAAAAATNYREGKLQLNGTITSPTIFQNQANTTSAFQVQNAAGGALFKVNTIDNDIVANGNGGYISLAIDSTVGSRDLAWRTSGVDRWIFRTNNDAETGSDAGSNFEIINRTDAGALIGHPLTITRSNGASAFRNSTNSTTAFQIQDSAGASLFTASTTGNQVIQIGTNTTSATPPFLYVAPYSNGANGSASITGNWASSVNWGIGAATNSSSDNTLRIGNVNSATNTFSATQNLNLLIGGTLGNSAAATLDVEGTGLFKNTANSTTAFQIQNAAGKNVLTADTSGGVVSLGNSGASGITGNLKFNFTAQTGSISLVPLNPSSTAYTINLPAENGTLCSTGSVCTGYAASSGSGSYIQNGTSTQSNANFNIQSAANGSVGGTIQGAAGQTASLLNLVSANSTPFAVMINNTTYGSTAAKGFGLWQENTGQGILGTNNQNNIVLDTNGRVGISGTSAFNPLARLHVSDAGGGASLFRVTDTTATARDVLDIADGGAATFRNQTDSTTAFQVQNAAGTATLISADTTNLDLTVGGNLLISKSSQTNIEWTKVSGTTGTVGGSAVTSIDSIRSSIVYNGSLYVGTEETGKAGVYRYNGSSSWTLVSSADTTGTIVAAGTSAIDSVYGMAVYNGKLYIGTAKSNAGEVYSYDGTTWTKISQSTAGTIAASGTASIDAVRSFAVYNSNLYAGTFESTKAEVYRYDGGTTWTKVSNATAGTISATGNTAADGADSLAVFNSSLYVGTEKSGNSNTEVLRYDGGTTWTRVNFDATHMISGGPVNTNIRSMVVYKGSLYLGGQKGSNAEVYRYDGVVGTMTLVSQGTGTITSGGTANIDAARLMVYDDSLYAYTSKTNVAEIYRYSSGVTWTKVTNATAGTIGVTGGTSAIDSVFTLTTYNGSIYGGTDEANSAEIYRYSDNVLEARTSDTAGVFSVGATGTSVFQNSTNSTTAFQVQNSAGDSLFTIDSTNSNITLLGNNTGELNVLTGSNWNNTTTIVGDGAGNTLREFTASVVANGYIYRIGGSNSTGSSVKADVEYARLNADGSIPSSGTGTWATTTSLPAAREYGGAVYSNGYIYYLGGSSSYNQGNAQNNVYYTKVNSDGTLGTWVTNTANLPNARNSGGVAAYNGYLYYIGGQTTGAAAVTDVYYAKLNADGSTATWTDYTATQPLPAVRTGIHVTVANGFLYAIGGATTGPFAARADVYVAKLNIDGTIAAWSSNNGVQMNSSRAYGGVYVANGYIYQVAGASGPSAAVQYAALNADGTTGNWVASTTSLPAARDSFGFAQANGYFYVVGGVNSTAQNTVYYASTSRIKLGGSLDLVGLGGENLGEGSTGGSLTAGNTTIVGTLNVQDQANFASSLSVNKNFTASGYALFQNATNSTTAFQIQNAAATTMFLVDTSNTSIRLGDASNNITLTASTFEPLLNGNARHTTRINLVPEFEGAVLTGDGSNNSGTMTSDFCSGTAKRSVNTGVCATSTDEHNYYSWTAISGTQDYDVWIRHQIPSDFAAFSSDTSINMFGWRTDSTVNLVELAMFQANGTQCGSTTSVATGTAAWTETAMTGSETGCTVAAGDIVTFKIKLTVDATDFVRAGEIRYDYLSKW